MVKQMRNIGTKCYNKGSLLKMIKTSKGLKKQARVDAQQMKRNRIVKMAPKVIII